MYAAGKGVVVVTTTRTGSGRVPGRSVGPPPGAASAGGDTARPRRAFIGGEDLAPIKARILLMLALARTTDPAEIQRMFLEY